MLELYHFHGATCGLKSRLALAEKGVEYVGHAVERDYLRTPEYRKLNPNGVVPTLIHNGDVVLESSCVINYVDDVFDGPKLKPDNPLGVARTWWWMKRADECLPMIGNLTYTVSMRPKLLKLSPTELEEHLKGIPIAAARARRRRIIEEGFESPELGQSIEGLQKMLSDMEKALTQNEWLVDDDYTLADTAMTPLVERLHELQCGPMVEQYPSVADWYERIQARPSYEACLGATPNPEKPLHTEQGKKSWPEIKKLINA